MRNGMNDIRGQRRAEKQFYDRDILQQCVVCGRLFCRRKDKVCSMDCLRKQETQKSDATF
jgi:hypothetical protein